MDFKHSKISPKCCILCRTFIRRSTQAALTIKTRSFSLYGLWESQPLFLQKMLHCQIFLQKYYEDFYHRRDGFYWSSRYERAKKAQPYSASSFCAPCKPARG